ncbi:MAG: hypothetical protein WBM86_11880, partial [Waterburya sp.]
FNLINKLEQGDILILDEIHEWSEEQEALNGLVMQQINERQFRCIEASATLYCDSLVQYHNKLIGEGVSVHLEVCTDKKIYEIQNVIYQDLLEFEPELKDTIQNTRKRVDQRNFLIWQAILYCLFQEQDNFYKEYDILIFFEAQHQIKTWKKKITQLKNVCDLPHEIFPVYGKLGFAEKIRAITHSSSPKILLSTNLLETGFNLAIAEDSEGLAVIDLLEKYEKYFDPETNIEKLRSVRISKAEQEQRRGRTGRESDGIYIAIPPAKSKEFGAFIEEKVTPEEPQEYPIPAIERQELSKILLKLRVHGVNLEDLPLFHFPGQENTAKAIENLQAIDCLNEKGEITPIGKIAAGINLSPSAARIVIEAMARFPDLDDLHDEALLVACILEKRGIIDRHKKDESYLNTPPKWESCSRENDKTIFKSDLIFQKYLLINKLNALQEKNEKKLEKNATTMQLSFQQIKKVRDTYNDRRKELSNWRKEVTKSTTRSKDRAASPHEFAFNGAEEKLRYCIFVGLPMWLCYSSYFHINEFVRKGDLQPEITRCNYLPYNFDSSYTDLLEFQPDFRQCLLGHNQKNIPKWIVANRLQHLESPTFSLYTEIDPSWVEALSEKLNKKRNAERYSIFYTQDNYIWHTVQFLLFNDAVTGIERIDEVR